MNKFNKRQGNAVKVRKIKGRATKKRVGASKRHKATVEVSGGQRTGKAARKRVKVQRLRVRALHTCASGEMLRSEAPWQIMQMKT